MHVNEHKLDVPWSSHSDTLLQSLPVTQMSHDDRDALMSPLRAHLPFSHFPSALTLPSSPPFPSRNGYLHGPASRSHACATRTGPDTCERLSLCACDRDCTRLRPDLSRAPCTLASTITLCHRAFAPPRTVSGPTKTRFRRWHDRRTSPVGNHAYVSLTARGLR